MKESELHQSSGIALSVINPNNGTHVVMNIPPGQRKGQLLLRGPFGERWIYMSLGVDAEALGDQDLELMLTTEDPSTARLARGVAELREASTGGVDAEAPTGVPTLSTMAAVAKLLGLDVFNGRPEEIAELRSRFEVEWATMSKEVAPPQSLMERVEEFADRTGSTVMSLTQTGGFKIEGEMKVEVSSGDPPLAAPETEPTGGPSVKGPQNVEGVGVETGVITPAEAPARPQAPKGKKAGG